MSDVVELFIAGVRGGGVPIEVYDQTVRTAPPAHLLAPRLLEALPAADGKGVFAATCAALALSADPGYRPVVEECLSGKGPAGVSVTSLLTQSRVLHGDALLWWFGVLRATGFVHEVNTVIYERAGELLDVRDAVVEHLVTRVSGPGFMAADAVEAMWLAGGPCESLEQLWARWIDTNRFDGRIDAPDGSTSAQFLAGPLENCVRAGRFGTDWWLLERALAHWRDLLGSDDDVERRRGLRNMAVLMTYNQDLAGRLPDGVLSALPRESPAATAISEGFSAITERKRHPDRTRLQHRVDDARRWLTDQARGSVDTS